MRLRQRPEAVVASRGGVRVAYTSRATAKINSINCVRVSERERVKEGASSRKRQINNELFVKTIDLIYCTRRYPVKFNEP